MARVPGEKEVEGTLEGRDVTRDELEISISQYLDGTLPESERASVEALLAHDPQAQALLAGDRALTNLLRSEPLPQVRWDRLAESISTAIDQEVAERAVQASWWIRMRVPGALALAASLLLAVGIAVHVVGSKKGGMNSPQNQAPGHENHVAVATLTVEGPQADVPSGPEVSEVSIGAGGSYAKESSLAPYADELDNRPARIVIASGIESDGSQAPSPF